MNETYIAGFRPSATDWNLEISGGREVYVTHNGKFVARFKYLKPKANARHFVKALKKLYTPEDYFAALASGLAPLQAMKLRGYVSLNEQKETERIALAAFIRGVH